VKYIKDHPEILLPIIAIMFVAAVSIIMVCMLRAIELEALRQ
jgi:hypothetical protein